MAKSTVYNQEAPPTRRARTSVNLQYRRRLGESRPSLIAEMSIQTAKRVGQVAARRVIARNKRAARDYALEERFEAGLVLEGWEVKSLRAGKAQIVDSYVLLRDGEAYLFGAQITPLLSASSHISPDPTRTRKLLLHARELARIFVATQAKGYACVATAVYWKSNRVKCEIALAKGKKQHDKRAAVKDREWARQKERLTKTNQRG